MVLDVGKKPVHASWLPILPTNLIVGMTRSA